MRRALRKLQSHVYEIGMIANDIDNRINVPMSEASPIIKGEGIIIPTLRLDYGRMHIDKKENKTWTTLRKTKRYLELIEKIEESKKITIDRKSLEELICEFIYEIITVLPVKKRKDDSWFKQILNNMTEILVQDITKETYSFNAIAPLFNFQMNNFEMDLGQYGKIRRAYFSEKRDFFPKYPIGVHPYGPERFDFILELERSNNATPDIRELVSNYASIAGNLVMLMRLLYGGDMGLEYIHIWSQPTFKEKKIGALHLFGAMTVPPLRPLRPGEEETVLENPEPKILIALLQSLERLPVHSFFFRALRRFGTALESKSPEERIIDSIIAFECLLGSREHVLSRVTGILTKDPASVRTFLDKCWKARHILVHGGGLEQAENAVGGDLEKKAKLLVKFLRICLTTLLVSIRPLDVANIRDTLDQKVRKMKKRVSTESSLVKKPISIEDFHKIDLRIGKIESCKRIEGSNQMCVEISLRTHNQISLIPYSSEVRYDEIVGKSVLFISNLKPRAMMGIESTGMLLEAQHADNPDRWSLVLVENIPIGSKIQ